MKPRVAVFLLLFLANAIAEAQTVPGTIDQFLPKRLQSASVVTYEMQEFLQNRVPKLPHPSTAKEWTAEAKRIRDHMLKEVVYHGWPKAWINSPPRFEDEGSLPAPLGAGYRAERFRYQVVPGFYSVAVLYEPLHLNGRVPAVLNVLGHYPTGEAMPFEQKLCINEALRGMIGLSLTLVDEGESRITGNEHYFGSDLDLVGVSGLGLFYLAMRRGLDYLYGDPDVDKSRIAMTGQSGGGWQTIILSSLDTRVKVAIPVAGFASLQGRLERTPGEPGDYEQIVPDLLNGQGYQTFVAMMAPRPLLELNNAEDSCCFRAPLVKPYIYTAIKPFYRLYGKRKAFKFHADAQVLAHNYDHDNRQQAYEFLDKWFHLAASPDEIPVGGDINTYNQLASGLPLNNLTILGLARQFAAKLNHPAVPLSAESRKIWSKRERAILAQVVNYEPVTVEHPWYLDNTNHNTVQSISFRLGMSNGLSATAVWIKSKWTPKNAPMTIIVDDGGRKGADEEVWNHYPEVGYQVERGNQVLVLSVLFTGDDNPLPGLDVPRIGYMMQAVGFPPLGLEVAQLVGITRWAKQLWHPSGMMLESSGYRMQVVSLVAGALNPHLYETIMIYHGTHGLEYILNKPVLSNRVPDMFCRDFYKDFDLKTLKVLSSPSVVTESNFISTG